MNEARLNNAEKIFARLEITEDVNREENNWSQTKKTKSNEEIRYKNAESNPGHNKGSLNYKMDAGIILLKTNLTIQI